MEHAGQVSHFTSRKTQASSSLSHQQSSPSLLIININIIINIIVIMMIIMINRHCVTHRGLKQLCTSYSLEMSEYFFDRSSWMIVMMLVMFLIIMVIISCC